MVADIWPIIHKERQALLDDVSTLTPEQWATQSLCDRWTVYQAFGHVVGAAKLTPGKFIGGMVGSGFTFNAMLDKIIERETASGPDVTVAEFRAHLTDTTSPPGPKDTWIGEIVLHSADIRRPLGISHEYDVDDVRRVADFYKNSNAIVGAKKRIAGVKLRATDVDWSTGDGPEVTGPVLSLAMAMTGRAVALDDLAGEGVQTLRARMCQ